MRGPLAIDTFVRRNDPRRWTFLVTTGVLILFSIARIGQSERLPSRHADLDAVLSRLDARFERSLTTYSDGRQMWHRALEHDTYERSRFNLTSITVLDGVSAPEPIVRIKKIVIPDVKVKILLVLTPSELRGFARPLDGDGLDEIELPTMVMNNAFTMDVTTLKDEVTGQKRHLCLVAQKPRGYNPVLTWFLVTEVGLYEISKFDAQMPIKDLLFLAGGNSPDKGRPQLCLVGSTPFTIHLEMKVDFYSVASRGLTIDLDDDGHHLIESPTHVTSVESRDGIDIAVCSSAGFCDVISKSGDTLEATGRVQYSNHAADGQPEPLVSVRLFANPIGSTLAVCVPARCEFFTMTPLDGYVKSHVVNFPSPAVVTGFFPVAFRRCSHSTMYLVSVNPNPKESPGLTKLLVYRLSKIHNSSHLIDDVTSSCKTAQSKERVAPCPMDFSDIMLNNALTFGEGYRIRVIVPFSAPTYGPIVGKGSLVIILEGTGIELENPSLAVIVKSTAAIAAIQGLVNEFRALADTVKGGLSNCLLNADNGLLFQRFSENSRVGAMDVINGSVKALGGLVSPDIRMPIEGSPTSTMGNLKRVTDELDSSLNTLEDKIRHMFSDLEAWKDLRSRITTAVVVDNLDILDTNMTDFVVNGESIPIIGTKVFPGRLTCHDATVDSINGESPDTIAKRSKHNHFLTPVEFRKPVSISGINLDGGKLTTDSGMEIDPSEDLVSLSGDSKLKWPLRLSSETATIANLWSLGDIFPVNEVDLKHLIAGLIFLFGPSSQEITAIKQILGNLNVQKSEVTCGPGVLVNGRNLSELAEKAWPSDETAVMTTLTIHGNVKIETLVSPELYDVDHKPYSSTSGTSSVSDRLQKILGSLIANRIIVRGTVCNMTFPDDFVPLHLNEPITFGAKKTFPQGVHLYGDSIIDKVNGVPMSEILDRLSEVQRHMECGNLEIPSGVTATVDDNFSVNGPWVEDYFSPIVKRNEVSVDFEGSQAVGIVGANDVEAPGMQMSDFMLAGESQVISAPVECRGNVIKLADVDVRSIGPFSFEEMNENGVSCTGAPRKPMQGTPIFTAPITKAKELYIDGMLCGFPLPDSNQVLSSGEFEFHVTAKSIVVVGHARFVDYSSLNGENVQHFVDMRVTLTTEQSIGGLKNFTHASAEDYNFGNLNGVPRDKIFHCYLRNDMPAPKITALKHFKNRLRIYEGVTQYGVDDLSLPEYAARAVDMDRDNFTVSVKFSFSHPVISAKLDLLGDGTLQGFTLQDIFLDPCFHDDVSCTFTSVKKFVRTTNIDGDLKVSTMNGKPSVSLFVNRRGVLNTIIGWAKIGNVAPLVFTKNFDILREIGRSRITVEDIAELAHFDEVHNGSMTVTGSVTFLNKLYVNEKVRCGSVYNKNFTKLILHSVDLTVEAYLVAPIAITLEINIPGGSTVETNLLNGQNLKEMVDAMFPKDSGTLQDISEKQFVVSLYAPDIQVNELIMGSTVYGLPLDNLFGCVPTDKPFASDKMRLDFRGPVKASQVKAGTVNDKGPNADWFNAGNECPMDQPPLDVIFESVILTHEASVGSLNDVEDLPAAAGDSFLKTPDERQNIGGTKTVQGKLYSDKDVSVGRICQLPCDQYSTCITPEDTIKIQPDNNLVELPGQIVADTIKVNDFRTKDGNEFNFDDALTYDTTVLDNHWIVEGNLKVPSLNDTGVIFLDGYPLKRLLDGIETSKLEQQRLLDRLMAALEEQCHYFRKITLGTAGKLLVLDSFEVTSSCCDSSARVTSAVLFEVNGVLRMIVSFDSAPGGLPEQTTNCQWSLVYEGTSGHFNVADGEIMPIQGSVRDWAYVQHDGEPFFVSAVDGGTQYSEGLSNCPTAPSLRLWTYRSSNFEMLAMIELPANARKVILLNAGGKLTILAALDNYIWTFRVEDGPDGAKALVKLGTPIPASKGLYDVIQFDPATAVIASSNPSGEVTVHGEYGTPLGAMSEDIVCKTHRLSSMAWVNTPFGHFFACGDKGPLQKVGKQPNIQMVQIALGKEDSVQTSNYQTLSPLEDDPLAMASFGIWTEAAHLMVATQGHGLLPFVTSGASGFLLTHKIGLIDGIKDIDVLSIDGGKAALILCLAETEVVVLKTRLVGESHSSDADVCPNLLSTATDSLLSSFPDLTPYTSANDTTRGRRQPHWSSLIVDDIIQIGSQNSALDGEAVKNKLVMDWLNEHLDRTTTPKVIRIIEAVGQNISATVLTDIPGADPKKMASLAEVGAFLNQLLSADRKASIVVIPTFERPKHVGDTEDKRQLAVQLSPFDISPGSLQFLVRLSSSPKVYFLHADW